MEKIDLDKLGRYVVEWRNGKPWSDTVDGMIAAKECAEKINEIVEWINNKKDQLL